MKIVKEDINFERNQDPKKSMDIGKESSYAKKQLFDKLDKKVRFNLGREPEESMKGLLDNIFEIEKAVEKLQKMDIKIEYISYFYGVSIQINVFNILDSNHVILKCLTEKDANILINIIKKLSYHSYDNFKIDSETFSISLKDLNWFDQLEKNRKELSKFFNLNMRVPKYEND